jgi:hypothetical protein
MSNGPGSGKQEDYEIRLPSPIQLFGNWALNYSITKKQSQNTRASIYYTASE